MLDKAIGMLVGLLVLALLIYGVYLGGKWFISLFTAFSAQNLALISLSLFLIPLGLVLIFALLEVDVTAPASISIMMLPFSLIGLVISLIWYLIRLI